MSFNAPRSIRLLSLLLVALAVGYAGVRLGQSLRDRNNPPVAEAPPFPFRPGDPFPDVVLADSTGTRVRSTELGATHGAVVLFLDPNCDGCTDMSIRWEQALADGFYDPSRVFGVSRANADANRQYRAANRLSFPIYQDVEDAFVRKYDVLRYPLEIVVGQSGTIRSVSDDSKSPVDGEAIRVLMTE